MASPKLELRVPEALLSLMKAAAAANGRNLSQEALATLAERYMGEDAAPERPAPEASTPRAQAAREAAAVAQAKTGVAVTSGRSRAQEAMDRAGTVQWDPNAKRTPYQKGSAGAGKGKR